ncbi:abortive infection protein [Fulvitalea axinellae]|uniref:Abortive infection protein n=1 Tax=Fulvitalea axinellae TaxID=1182444 RepID=A0AAU9CSK5_9BACT|nr:abortive infection protein [Fulvitalea axinellae]
MYIEKAFKGRSKFYWYLLGTIILIVSQVIGSVPLIVVAVAKGKLEALDNFNELMNMGISQNMTLVLMMLPFVASFICLTLWIKYVQRQTVTDTVTARARIDWNRVLFGAGVWFALSAVSALIGYVADPDNFVWQADWGQFFNLLIIAIVLIPIQAGTEELVFRAYYMQGIGVLAKYRWIPLFLTSTFFGLLHMGNPEVTEFGVAVMLPQYILIGLVFGVMTLMDDGAELAIGAHIANNIFASLFFTHSSSALQTPALFKVQEVDPSLGWIEITFMGVLACVFFGRKYKWNDWGKMFGRIGKAPIVKERNPEVLDQMV